MFSKGRGKTGYIFIDLYRFYKLRFRAVAQRSEANVDRSTYGAILNDFNTSLSKAIILHALDFRMPYKLGKLRIRRYDNGIKLDENGNIDTSSLSPDWKETWKLWDRIYPGKEKKEIKKIQGKQVVYYLNRHTDYNGFSLFWSKKGTKIINNKIYSFIFTFTNKRYLAQVLKKDPKITFYE